MEPLSFPAPQRRDDDGIEIIDEIRIIDDITVVPNPQQQSIGPDLAIVTDDVPVRPGPKKSRTEPDAPGSLAALFGPEMTAGISVTILFVVFAVVLAMGATNSTESEQEPPVAPVEAITVEIGEAAVLERGE